MKSATKVIVTKQKFSNGIEKWSAHSEMCVLEIYGNFDTEAEAIACAAAENEKRK